MVQKNEMSARALTMEELENVNGGHPRIRMTGPKNGKRMEQFVDFIKTLFKARIEPIFNITLRLNTKRSGIILQNAFLSFSTRCRIRFPSLSVSPSQSMR